MLVRRLLFAQLFVVFLLAVSWWTAVAYALYWRIWWLDIPMHILAGVWAGLCGAWIMERRGEHASLLWCTVFVLAIGVSWEIFEYSEGIALPRYTSYPVDTAKDILMDLLGAFLAWTAVRKAIAHDGT